MSEHIHDAVDRVRRFLDAREGHFPIDVLAVVTRTGDRLLASDLRALVKEVDPDPVVARFEGFLIDARDKAWADGYNHAKVEMLSATNAPCFARGVDGEGNPNCRLASDHDGQHSDSTSLTVTVNKSSAGVGLPNEEARWWQIRDLAAKGYADAGPAGVADALEPVLEDWFFEVRREAGLVAVREYVENGPICDE